jgi:hypothetical protein
MTGANTIQSFGSGSAGLTLKNVVGNSGPITIINENTSATADVVIGTVAGSLGNILINPRGITAVSVDNATGITNFTSSPTMPTPASSDITLKGATTEFVSQIPYLNKTNSLGIFEVIGATSYGAENLSTSSLAVATTQAFLLGVYLTKGSVLGRYIFFQSAAGTAVSFRCALYNSSFSLLAGTDFGAWNATSTGVVGVPTVQVLASPYTVPITGNYYVYCNPNVAMATNRIYSLAPNGALANMFNLTTNTSPVLVGPSDRFRSGIVSGLTASSPPPASLLGLTATLNFQPPYLLLQN